MRYRALLMDFYGTLVEEDDAIIGRIVGAIAERAQGGVDRGQVLASWRCASSYGSAFRTQRTLELESLRALLQEYDVALDAEALSEELFTYWRSPAPYPVSSRVLGEVTVPVCLVSNIDSADLAAAVRGLGWHFEHIITSEDCRAYKPRPEPFLAALDLLGLQAHEVLHVGDSLSGDVAGARALDIGCAWVNRKGRRLPRECRYRPTHEIADIGELPGLLSQS
ncbi:MAG: hypothetical protein AMS16_06935 [Planctomycetes bacterium DG_58]|nr:MAG: hypothetical protein AMS16_06935 [Planctomycetes bacterium DG_58]